MAAPAGRETVVEIDLEALALRLRPGKLGVRGTDHDRWPRPTLEDRLDDRGVVVDQAELLKAGVERAVVREVRVPQRQVLDPKNLIRLEGLAVKVEVVEDRRPRALDRVDVLALQRPQLRGCVARVGPGRSDIADADRVKAFDHVANEHIIVKELVRVVQGVEKRALGHLFDLIARADQGSQKRLRPHELLPPATDRGRRTPGPWLLAAGLGEEPQRDLRDPVGVQLDTGIGHRLIGVDQLNRDGRALRVKRVQPHRAARKKSQRGL